MVKTAGKANTKLTAPKPMWRQYGLYEKASRYHLTYRRIKSLSGGITSLDKDGGTVEDENDFRPLGRRRLACRMP